MADVVLAHHYRDEEGKDCLPGDRISVSDEVASLLVQAGYASPARASDARAAGVPEEEAASKKK